MESPNRNPAIFRSKLPENGRFPSNLPAYDFSNYPENRKPPPLLHPITVLPLRLPSCLDLPPAGP